MGAVRLELVHPDDIKRVRAEFAEIWSRPGIGPPVEYRVRHKDGHWIHLEASANNLRDDPEVQGMLIIHRDVTARVGMLSESLQMFRSTFDQAAVGLAHLDLEGGFIRANQKLCKTVRYGREELLRKTFNDITHPSDLEANRDRMRQLLSGEIDQYSMDERCVRKDGSHLWVTLNVSLMCNASGEPSYVVTVVDNIDERKKVEMILETL